jgi:multicomponent Na+:H+ antiporter subunit D
VDLAPPLVVALPLITAAALAATAAFLPRRFIESVSLGASAAVTVLCLLLLGESSAEPLVYWFGGWEPRDSLALGVSFVIDPLGAGLATLSAVLVTGSLIFSWRYFDAVGGLYHCLMLVFLAGIVGFSLSGDLFNMFVFLEVLSVTAIALTGYKIEEPGPLQGALNFGVTNGIGAFFVLWGIALLYGRTGALNLAQMGQSLARGEPDALVITALALLGAGFFIKAAIVPFHFWLADAYATAPLPVCVLLGGVVSELGLYALARVYWTVFSSPLGEFVPQARSLILALGALTALVGAIMCFAQHHLQRMIAFAVISHAGLLLIGLGLLTPAGVGGAAIYMLADGLVKASLFMCIGILQHRLAGVDEMHLRGRGRALLGTAALFVVGGLALVGPPPFGTFAGKALVEEEAKALGLYWVTPLFVACSLITGAAVLRAAGRIFAGWGPPVEHEDVVAQEEGEEEESETVAGRDRTPAVMFIPALALLAAGLGVGLSSRVLTGTEAAAEIFVDRVAYADTVLSGVPHPVPKPPPPHGLKPSEVVLGVASVAGTFALAALALGRRLVPERWRDLTWAGPGRVVDGLRALHSGHVGDYVAWLTFGVAALGGAFAFVLR